MITQNDVQNLQQAGYKIATPQEFNEWFLTIAGECDQKIKMEVIGRIQKVKQKFNLSPGVHIIPKRFRG